MVVLSGWMTRHAPAEFFHPASAIGPTLQGRRESPSCSADVRAF